MKEIKTLYFQTDYPETPNDYDLWIQPKPYKIINHIDLNGKISQVIEYGWNLLHIFSEEKRCWVTVFDFQSMQKFLHMLKYSDYCSFCFYQYQQSKNDGQIDFLDLCYERG